MLSVNRDNIVLPWIQELSLREHFAIDEHHSILHRVEHEAHREERHECGAKNQPHPARAIATEKKVRGIPASQISVLTKVAPAVQNSRRDDARDESSERHKPAPPEIGVAGIHRCRDVAHHKCDEAEKREFDGQKEGQDCPTNGFEHVGRFLSQSCSSHGSFGLMMYQRAVSDRRLRMNLLEDNIYKLLHYSQKSNS